MTYIKTLLLAIGLFVVNVTFVSAEVVSSDNVMQVQQHQFKKHQIMAMLNTTEVEQRLVELGVEKSDAQARINHMTPDELTTLNEQLNEAPAGGIIGTIVTVLVVVAVLDVMGITDVYPFIRPIS